MSLDALASRFNPLVVFLLRSRLHGLLSSGLMLLSFTGRKSGRRVSIPVGYQCEGSIVTVMVSEARHKTWWRNFREPGPVEMRIRGRARQGSAQVAAPASEEFRRCCVSTLKRMPWLGRVFGIDYQRSRGLGEAELAQLAEQIAVVRITLA